LLFFAVHAHSFHNSHSVRSYYRPIMRPDDPLLPRCPHLQVPPARISHVGGRRPLQQQAHVGVLLNTRLSQAPRPLSLAPARCRRVGRGARISEDRGCRCGEGAGGVLLNPRLS
jgi:hypothetical protein